METEGRNRKFYEKSWKEIIYLILFQPLIGVGAKKTGFCALVWLPLVTWLRCTVSSSESTGNCGHCTQLGIPWGYCDRLFCLPPPDTRLQHWWRTGQWGKRASLFAPSSCPNCWGSYVQVSSTMPREIKVSGVLSPGVKRYRDLGEKMSSATDGLLWL